jgi:hypothetical protein
MGETWLRTGEGVGRSQGQALPSFLLLSVLRVPLQDRNALQGFQNHPGLYAVGKSSNPRWYFVPAVY